jgi:hypothetical protein
MAKADLSIDVRGIPEVIWSVRREMANLLREQADVEISPAVARRLRELADAFESGASPR